MEPRIEDWKREAISRAYYAIKPLLPRSLQIAIRRQRVRQLLRLNRDVWPVDPRAGEAPAGWKGWPEGKRFALVLTHDVESARGVPRCLPLAGLEAERGMRSSFNFVGNRYPVPCGVREELVRRGFEIGLHGLCHDGRDFDSHAIFSKRLPFLKERLAQWGAVGFRAPSMHGHLGWIREIGVEYDLSTFDTDPFEPRADGVGTIFPFHFPGEGGLPGFTELPYTLPQDFTLFVLLRERTPRIWREKLDWIASRGGMALINVHPDYLAMDGVPRNVDEYPVSRYSDFLDDIATRYRGRFYHALPRDLARHFRAGAEASRSRPAP